MGGQDLFFGASGWLLVILLLYNIAKYRKQLFKFIKEYIQERFKRHR